MELTYLVPYFFAKKLVVEAAISKIRHSLHDCNPPFNLITVDGSEIPRPTSSDV